MTERAPPAVDGVLVQLVREEEEKERMKGVKGGVEQRKTGASAEETDAFVMLREVKERMSGEAFE